MIDRRKREGTRIEGDVGEQANGKKKIMQEKGERQELKTKAKDIRTKLGRRKYEKRRERGKFKEAEEGEGRKRQIKEREEKDEREWYNARQVMNAKIPGVVNCS